jgi:drug/metabolite transporter (DMT)-like permease
MRAMAEPRPITRRGWILFGLMGVIWGVPYLFIKVAVEYLSPPVVVFGRTSIAAVPLLIFAIHIGAVRPALAHWRPLLAFATLEMAIPWLLLTSAEQELPSGLTGLLIACVPIVGAVVAYLLGDRSALRPVRLAGIALGLAGVALLVATDLSGDAPLWSVAEVLLVCVGYATAPFIANRRLSSVPDVGVVALSLTAVAIVYAPFAWITRPDQAPPARAWAAVLALAFLCTAIAFLVFFRLIAEVGPARSTLITFVNPAVAVVVGAIVLDEEITVATVAGFALVLAGCWLATRHRPEVIGEAPVEPDALRRAGAKVGRE